MYSEQTMSNFNAEAQKRGGAEKAKNLLSELIIDTAIARLIDTTDNKHEI